MTFPTDRAAKRALMDELQAKAPQLLSEINAIRVSFPSAKLVYLQLDGVEYGEPSPPGVEPFIELPSAGKTVEQRWKARLDTRARQARKRKQS